MMYCDVLYICIISKYDVLSKWSNVLIAADPSLRALTVPDLGAPWEVLLWGPCVRSCCGGPCARSSCGGPEWGHAVGALREVML